jgi:hypothetical protein
VLLPFGSSVAEVSGRISIHDVVVAAKKVRRMTQAQKLRLADEIYETQPNLLAACLAQQQLGPNPWNFFCIFCLLALRR